MEEESRGAIVLFFSFFLVLFSLELLLLCRE